jgi:6-phosphogluconate dehydrogenase
MLPTGAIVRDVLLGRTGAARVLGPEALVIDMSSSAPMGTRALAEELKALGIGLIDAPVSGGVRRAADGSLAIMAGGEADQIARARPLLEAMGKSIFMTGPVGSGHAVKALNNYVSAAGLQAACEAAIIAGKVRHRRQCAGGCAQRIDRAKQFHRSEDEALHPLGQLRLRLLHGADGEGLADGGRPRQMNSA